jgi:hypothetical protein
MRNIGFSRTLRRTALLPAGMALLVVCGCSSSTKPGGGGAQDSDNSGSHIDVGCVMDHVEKPSESFHYSYKYADASTWVDHEADVTPQTLEVTIKNASGTRSFHGVRSDDTSWNSAILDVTDLAFTALTGRLAGIDGTSAIVRQGAEDVNGYSSTKYAVDTGAANSSDQRQWATLFGAGSFDKGTVWMGPDGCAVKVVLDEGVSIDGKIQKRHYEISRARKQ